MIRLASIADTAAVAELAVASGLFPAGEAGAVEKLMADYFSVKSAEGHACLLDVNGEAVAVAYYEPAPAADRVWYLTMIAVRPGHQGQGRGGALLRQVEGDLRARGQRLLLVQTSSLPGFERARAFYLNCGYDQEARVRDFYEPGDDMILFRKDLAA